MQQKQRSGLVQIGGALAILGVGVKVALAVGAFLNPLASIAIIVGLILLAVGLVAPGKR